MRNRRTPAAALQRHCATAPNRRGVASLVGDEQIDGIDHAGRFPDWEQLLRLVANHQRC